MEAIWRLKPLLSLQVSEQASSPTCNRPQQDLLPTCMIWKLCSQFVRRSSYANAKVCVSKLPLPVAS